MKSQNSQAVTLPSVIRGKVSKLPDAARDVVAQQLRNPPQPPVIYEEALRQLAAVRDIETIKRVLHAAEGLALWGRMHEDNRVIFEAQKLKAHALRQMFICAKMLGNPYEVLLDKKIYSGKARRGEELASFDEKEDIDRIANELGPKGRPEHLVGKIAERSPLFRKWVEENVRKREGQDRAEATRLAKPLKPVDIYLQQVGNPLYAAAESIRSVSKFDFAQCTAANKKRARATVTEIMELLDAIIEACK